MAADEETEIVLAVAKDPGGLAVLTRPMEILAQDPQVKVVWVAEGLAMKLLTDAGKTIYGGLPQGDNINSQTLVRYDIDPVWLLDEALLGKARLRAVVASMGAPNNLEGGVVREAVRRGVSTVIVSDIHGSALRADLSVEEPNLDKVLVTALDSEDARLVREHFNGPKAPFILVTGSPAFDKFANGAPIEVPPVVRNLIQSSRCVVFILGQDDCTTDFLGGPLDLLDSLGGSCLAIVGLHPKFLKVPELCNLWLDRVKKAKVPVLWATNAATTHQYMAASNIVISGYSTGLLEGPLLNHGPLAIAWSSPRVIANMEGAMGGLKVFPAVTYGAAHQVSSPEELLPHVQRVLELSEHGFRDQARAIIRDRLRVDGKAAERVAAVIRRHAGF